MPVRWFRRELIAWSHHRQRHVRAPMAERRDCAPAFSEQEPPMHSTFQNHCLASLSETDLIVLRPHLAAIELPLGTTLYEQGDTVARVYFPESGVISFVVGLSGGQDVEA